MPHAATRGNDGGVQSDAPSMQAAAIVDAAVSIRTFQFAPDTVRVKAGTRVVWTNTDQIAHTITSAASRRSPLS